MTEKTKADAQALARYIVEQQTQGVNVVAGLRAARQAKAPKGNMPTLKAAMTSWFDMRTSGVDAELRYSSRNVYEKTLGAHCFKFQWQGQPLGETPVNEITTKALVAMMQAARSKGSGRAVRGHLKHPLNGLFRYLIKSEILPAGSVNPAASLGDHLPKIKRSKVAGRLEFFEPGEVEQLLGAGKVFFAKKDNPHVNILPLVMTALGTGMRWGELAALKRQRVNLKRRQIEVCETISRGPSGPIFTPPKDHEARSVPISASLAAVLERHLWNVQQEGIANEWDDDQKALVFPNPWGRPLSHTRTFMAWKAWLKFAKLPVRRLHGLRHTYASALLNAGVDIRRVQQWLGHSSISLTVDVYGHLVKSEAHETQAAEALDQYMAGSS